MAADKLVDSTQLDGAMTATANAIRAKTGAGDSIAWDSSNGFKSAIEHIDDWHKPAAWPDIEQLALPSSDTTRMYFLYDCETEVRYAGFSVDNIATGNYSIAKYINGVLSDFDSESATFSVNNVYIPLPNDCKYAVIRVELTEGRVLFCADSNYGLYYTTNNSGGNQPCLWMYGKMYSSSATTLYMNGSCGTSALTLERARLYLSSLVKIGYGFADTSLKSLIINDGDFNHTGPLYDSSSSSFFVDGDFTAKNVNTASNRMPGFNRKVKNFNLDGFSITNGSISAQQMCQDNNALKSASIRTSGLKITSLYYTFTGNVCLESVDFTGCDFSEMTSTANAFNNAKMLKDLILGNNLNIGIDLSASYSLSHESLVNGIIAKLATVQTTQTLKLSNISKNKLTAEEIAVATAKGWTVA